MTAPLLIRAVQGMAALLLAGLVIAVFVNVVLRFAFNSGFVMTEELSRIGLIWLVFLGAIAVLHQGQHIAMTMVVEKLSRRGQILVALAGLALMILCDMMLLLGAWRQLGFAMNSSFPVSGLPTAVIYAPGLIAAGAFASISLWRAIRIMTGRLGPEAHFGFASAGTP